MNASDNRGSLVNLSCTAFLNLSVTSFFLLLQLGNFSFEGDSLPEFSEFEDTPSEVLAYKTQRYFSFYFLSI